MPKKTTPKSQAKIKSQFTHTLFHTKKNISQVTMRFLTPTHIHIFFALFNQKKKKTENGYRRKHPIHFFMKP